VFTNLAIGKESAEMEVVYFFSAALLSLRLKTRIERFLLLNLLRRMNRLFRKYRINAEVRYDTSG